MRCNSSSITPRFKLATAEQDAFFLLQWQRSQYVVYSSRWPMADGQWWRARERGAEIA